MVFKGLNMQKVEWISGFIPNMCSAWIRTYIRLLKEGDRSPHGFSRGRGNYTPSGGNITVYTHIYCTYITVQLH